MLDNMYYEKFTRHHQHPERAVDSTPKIVSENFRQVGKVNNKSSHGYYERIHCNM